MRSHLSQKKRAAMHETAVKAERCYELISSGSRLLSNQRKNARAVGRQKEHCRTAFGRDYGQVQHLDQGDVVQGKRF